MTARNQRGATLVEAALTILVFLAFLLAVLELGRAYNMYQVITNAAREGARFAVAPCAALPSSPVCPYGAGVLPTKADVQTRVNNFLSSAHIRTNTAVVNICQGPADGSCPASSTMPNPCLSVNGVNTCFTVVDVTAPYEFIFFRFATLNISGEASMRNETN